jgi:energy-coupling factor transporter ATP-binding protein EcfA2
MLNKALAKVKTGRAIELALFESKYYGIVDLDSGDMYQRKTSFVSEPTYPDKGHTRKYIESTLPIRVGQSNEDLTLPFGLVVISGPTAVGKSSFVRALPGITRLLVVECPDSIEELKGTPIYASVDVALLAAARQTAEHGGLMALDSLRAPLFETDGPAGARGMIMAFFTQITRVSNTLARNGITIVATVNPMDDDPLFEKAFLSKLSASVPCFISLTPSSDPARGVFEGTVSTREERVPQRFSLDSRERRSVVSEEVGFVMEFPEPDKAPLSEIQLSNVKEK